VICALGLGGCADNPRVRTLAEQVGKYATAHQAATDDFKARFEHYNTQLNDRLVARDLGTEEVIQSTIRQRQTWALAGDAKSEKAFASNTQVTDEAILLRVSATFAAPRPLDAGNLDAQMATAVAGAAELSKKPSTWEELQAFADVVSGIHDTLTTIRKDAVDAEAKAKPLPPNVTPSPAN
jgi:hypothetical protein